MVDRIIQFFLDNKLVAALLLLTLIGWGLATAPFDWDLGAFPRDPVPVDAIPDIGENQQIVFTEWEGRSPRDIEDQITYPLTTELLSLPGVKTVRSNSMFGFSTINVIFEEDVDFYWSRSRILEQLNSLPRGLLPDDVQPALGPDATGVGQVFWYTLEGRDKSGNPTGGWDLHELRSFQDYLVRYELAAADGVAEVASIGGHVREYQVDLDPVALQERNVSVMDVANAVRQSNEDVGARTVEVNRAEYVVRGLGYLRSVGDLEESVVTVNGDTPVHVRDVARVNLGPAQRRGVLDKGGAEAVGGVVVARYGENPLEVINNVKEVIEGIQPGLPTRQLADGTTSQVQIVPFYDRSGLIYETLGTLEEALTLQVLITVLVVIVMVMHLRSALVISALLPVAVLMSFIMMKYVGVDANVVALAGIAISIGAVVDMGIILTENILRHMQEAKPAEKLRDVIFRAASEVSPAVITALTTTIVSFLPVFLLHSAEGRLFGPLAWTKTFVLFAALVITITLIPAIAHTFFSIKGGKGNTRVFWNALLILVGLASLFVLPWAGLILLGLGLSNLASHFADRQAYLPAETVHTWQPYTNLVIIGLGLSWVLARYWLPLGPAYSTAANWLFVVVSAGALLGGFAFFLTRYEQILRLFLRRKALFLSVPAIILLLGLLSWRGFDGTFRPLSWSIEQTGTDVTKTAGWTALSDRFPGLDREFMPTLDEGSFLLMPTTLPHAGVEESKELMQIMDMRVASIPEVEAVVGKIGRVESPLDPAPLSMFETVVQYKSEYKTDEHGRRVRFQVDDDGNFVRDANGELVPDRNGRYYRQWRNDIHSTDDIWDHIAQAADLPGVSRATKLGPIETRNIMLQTGMRANIGVQIRGPDLETIDAFSLDVEEHIRQAEGVRPQSVYADRVVGKPYLEIDLDRTALARHGLSVQEVQQVIGIGIGGPALTQTVEGRERYPVRVRYAREERNSPEQIGRMLVPTQTGSQVPLGQLAEIRYTPGPMNVRSENTFPTTYVTFDNEPGTSAVEAAENVRQLLNDRVESGALTVPAGVTFTLEGEYRNQQRASERLQIILPITLMLIFLLLYFQFQSTTKSLIIFSGIAVAWAGGFIMLWLYGQPGFLDIPFPGLDLQALLQVEPIHLSVAVWVGFLALFGIAVDDGVVISTYLDQSFERLKPQTIPEIREAVVQAGLRRVRPCLMTTATTMLALLPLLTATGRGAEIMRPMAVPIFGGMLIQIMTLFVVPVLYALWHEWRLTTRSGGPAQ